MNALCYCDSVLYHNTPCDILSTNTLSASLINLFSMNTLLVYVPQFPSLFHFRNLKFLAGIPANLWALPAVNEMQDQIPDPQVNQREDESKEVGQVK